MDPDIKQKIGKFGLEVSQMGLGGAPFGNWAISLEEQSVIDTIEAAYKAGIRYFDTAPLYGYGLSESRYGNGLSRYSRDNFVISTKVGRTLVKTSKTPVDPFFVNTPSLETEFDYSRDAVLRSIEGSLQRLQTDRIDILLIHDPDEGAGIMSGAFDPYSTSHFSEVMEQTYPILNELRTQKVVGAIGLGMNQWQMLYDFAKEGDFDCFLLAGRYTLLEQEPLEQLLPICEEKNIRIIIGGPYNSGILATGAIEGAYYNYMPAPLNIIDLTRRIEDVCTRYQVSLQAAALQFPFGHPAIATIIPGARSVDEIESNITFLREKIPADFWKELRDLELVRPNAPLPKSE